MLRYILLDLRLFRDGMNRLDRKGLLAFLEALTCWDEIYLEQNPNTPPLYQSGVVYAIPEQFQKGVLPSPEKIYAALRGVGVPDHLAEKHTDVMVSGENFRDIQALYENKRGDCFPLTQKIIVRSKSTRQYEIVSIADLRHVYGAYDALSYNFRSCKYEFKNIIGFVDKGVQPVAKARLSNGTDLVATYDHKFWTLRGNSARTATLEQCTMQDYYSAYLEKTTGRRNRQFFKARARILQAAKIPALNVVNPSSAEAYLAGMYAAEGECSDGKHTRIGQHKMSIRMKIESALAEVGTSFHYSPGRGPTPGSGAQYSLHGGRSNPIVAMMRGQGTDSFDKRVPQSFLSGSEDVVSRVLEGHGDGDAWRPANGKYKRPGVEAIYATSSDVLMEQLRFGALVLGRPTYAYQYEDHQGEGDSPIWRLHEYNDEAVKLRTRKELLEEDLPGLRYGTVRNIHPFGSERVGCIEVEDNHNFFLADGTLVSNCDNVGCVRAAELRSCGLDASPFITYKKRADGGTTVHVVTRYPDNTVEDPSRILGMGGYRHKAERDEELRRLAERREIYAKKLADMKASGREFSEKEIERLERLAKYLQPPPADFDPVAVGLQFDRKNMR